MWVMLAARERGIDQATEALTRALAEGAVVATSQPVGCESRHVGNVIKAASARGRVVVVTEPVMKSQAEAEWPEAQVVSTRVAGLSPLPREGVELLVIDECWPESTETVRTLVDDFRDVGVLLHNPNDEVSEMADVTVEMTRDWDVEILRQALAPGMA